MATSEPQLAVKASLTPSELGDVGALVREARWNQLAADWRIFIEFGRLYAVHSEAGRIVATTATLPYGGRFAWISMVLVAGEYPRRGLATTMLRRGVGGPAAGEPPAPRGPPPPRPARSLRGRLPGSLGLSAPGPPGRPPPARDRAPPR